MKDGNYKNNKRFCLFCFHQLTTGIQTLKMSSSIFSIVSNLSGVGSSCSIETRDERSGINNSSLKGLPNKEANDIFN